jgi:hypothetical protein
MEFRTYYADLGHVDQDYGYQSINARILVDGQVGGKVKVHLLSRTKGFHGMCDSISGDLQDVAATFFTKSGKPRASVPSVHQALTSEEKSMPSLLYIDVFELKVDYWTHTNVGSRALRALLTDTLVKRWALVMYLPDGDTHCPEQDTNEQNHSSRLRSPG